MRKAVLENWLSLISALLLHLSSTYILANVRYPSHLKITITDISRHENQCWPKGVELSITSYLSKCIFTNILFPSLLYIQWSTYINTATNQLIQKVSFINKFLWQIKAVHLTVSPPTPPHPKHIIYHWLFVTGSCYSSFQLFEKCHMIVISCQL